jgi:hypothetical protein
MVMIMIIIIIIIVTIITIIVTFVAAENVTNRVINSFFFIPSPTDLSILDDRVYKNPFLK